MVNPMNSQTPPMKTVSNEWRFFEPNLKYTKKIFGENQIRHPIKS